jgi:hypothetical protein
VCIYLSIDLCTFVFIVHVFLFIPQMCATYLISRITCGPKYGFLPSAGECVFMKSSTYIDLLTILLRPLSAYLFHISPPRIPTTLVIGEYNIGRISFAFEFTSLRYLPHLILPYLTLPYLTLPYLTSPYLTLPLLSSLFSFSSPISSPRSSSYFPLLHHVLSSSLTCCLSPPFFSSPLFCSSPLSAPLLSLLPSSLSDTCMRTPVSVPWTLHSCTRAAGTKT